MATFKYISLIAIEAVLLAFLAPAVSGFISKVKNTLRMRKGPGILQPYYDIRKLFCKDEVISGNVSWIFYAAPAVVLAASFIALAAVLFIDPMSFNDDSVAIFIAVFFILGLGRFFMALAGLDAASSFGGI